MKTTVATVLIILLTTMQAWASTRSIQGLVTEKGDKTFALQVLWNAGGHFAERKWKLKRLTKDATYHIDGEACDEAAFWSAVQVGSRVSLVDGSRGTSYLNVFTEAHLPVVSQAKKLADGHLVITLPQAVQVARWGRRGTTAENWPYRPATLQIRISADKSRAFGHITSAGAQAVEVDVSGLTIDDTTVSGKVTATVRPTYGGEKQENRTYAFSLDGNLAEGALTGSWKSDGGGGEMTGRIEATKPMGDDLVLWVISRRGLNPSKPEKPNTLLIPFKAGVAQKDGVRVLHYKGIKHEGACQAAEVTLKDGVVSGSITYGAKGGTTLKLEGIVLGSYVALRCAGPEPLVESYAAGRLWPAHPKSADLVPLISK